MKSRQEIKALAREALRAQRGTAILLFFLFMVLAGFVGAIGGVFAVFVPVLGSLISLALSICIMVMAVNSYGEYIKIYRGEEACVSGLFAGFKVNFLRKLGGMWWMALWVMLWSLLFVIPGMIKALAYFATPFILADCPNVKARDALKLSMRMTHGHKGKLFVMMLSFIGWGILASLTLGILGIVFVFPYMYLTYAGFYTELRDQAIANGTIAPAEFGM